MIYYNSYLDNRGVNDDMRLAARWRHPPSLVSLCQSLVSGWGRGWGNTSWPTRHVTNTALWERNRRQANKTTLWKRTLKMGNNTALWEENQSSRTMLHPGKVDGKKESRGYASFKYNLNIICHRII